MKLVDPLRDGRDHLASGLLRGRALDDGLGRRGLLLAISLAALDDFDRVFLLHDHYSVLRIDVRVQCKTNKRAVKFPFVRLPPARRARLSKKQFKGHDLPVWARARRNSLVVRPSQ